MASKTFEDVELWQKAHKWVLGVYKLTENFPKQEMFWIDVTASTSGCFGSGELCGRIQENWLS